MLWRLIFRLLHERKKNVYQTCLLSLCLSASNTTHPKGTSSTPLSQTCSSSSLPSQQRMPLTLFPRNLGTTLDSPIPAQLLHPVVTKVCWLGLQSMSQGWPPLCPSTVIMSSQWPPSQAWVPGTALIWVSMHPFWPFTKPTFTTSLSRLKPSLAPC